MLYFAPFTKEKQSPIVLVYHHKLSEIVVNVITLVHSMKFSIRAIVVLIVRTVPPLRNDAPFGETFQTT
jgi:hypothetical protein